jgi:RNA polymerase sigma factor (TIGR02999 family)
MSSAAQSGPAGHPITAVVNDWQGAGGNGDEATFALVYDELRKMAGRTLGGAGRHLTVTPTELVHELCLRLQTREQRRWPSRRHFYAGAAKAMRRMLIDHLRARTAQKRGAGGRRVQLDDIAAVYEVRQIDLLAVDEAMANLAMRAPRSAEVAELRVFMWMSSEEIADVLGLCRRQVDRLWDLARACLCRELREDPDGRRAST